MIILSVSDSITDTHPRALSSFPSYRGRYAVIGKQQQQKRHDVWSRVRHRPRGFGGMACVGRYRRGHGVAEEHQGGAGEWVAVVCCS